MRTSANRLPIKLPIAPFHTTFVIQSLWNWFVADALHAAELSYSQAVGILIVVAVLRHNAENTYLDSLAGECIQCFER